MVNTTIESPVELVGKGFAYRYDDQYQPGEYSKLINMYMTSSGTLRTRNAAHSFLHVGGSHRYDLIAGHYKDKAILSNNNAAPFYTNTKEQSTTQSSTVNYNGAFKTAVLAKRPTVGSDGGAYLDARITVLGFFEYNGYHYAITQGTYRLAQTTYCYIVVMKGLINSTVVLEWSVFTAGDLIWSDSFIMAIGPGTDYYQDGPVPDRYPTLSVKDWLVYKDRLWIIIGDTLYGSAVSEPEKFSVVNDGFFNKFPGLELKDIEALADQLVVVADSSIYALSYDTDPNVDSEVSIISDVVGGEAATTLGDIIYVVKVHSIYAIQGLRVSKVYDLDLPGLANMDLPVRHTASGTGTQRFTQGSVFDVCLESLEESLYIGYRFITPITDFAQNGIISSFYDVKYSYTQVGGGLTADSQYLYRLDTTNGMVSQYGFGSNGFCMDMYYVPIEDPFNQTNLVCLGAINSITNTRVFSLGTRPPHITSVLPTTISGNPYKTIALDVVNNSLNPAQLFAERFEFGLQFRNYSPPDGSRYLQKRFRTIQLEMKVPFDSFSKEPTATLTIASGDKADVDTVTRILQRKLSTAAVLSKVGIETETIRFGVNQRCKKISIEIYSPLLTYNTLVVGDVASSYCSIRSIMTTWLATSRGPANDTLGS